MRKIVVAFLLVLSVIGLASLASAEHDGIVVLSTARIAR